MASKCKNFFFSILPICILFISLFQLYFHYSTIVTIRNKELYEKDGQNIYYNFQLLNHEFDLNLKKINENFDDSPLMNINFIKNTTLNFFEKINEKKEKKTDKRIYMLFYLIFHDIVYLIFVYIFYFGGYKSGIIKIIFQILRFYFNFKRIKLPNRDLYPFQVIINFLNNNILFRGWNLFIPDGFEIFKYICNYVIILDFIWLYILIKKKNSKKKKSSIKREIMTDDQRCDYIKEDSFGKEKEGMSEKNNIINESNNDNDVQKGKINLDEGYEEEESEHFSEEPINEQDTN